MINLKYFRLVSCLFVAVLFIFVTIDFADSRGRGGGHGAHRGGGGGHKASHVNRRGPSRSGSMTPSRSRQASPSRKNVNRNNVNRSNVNRNNQNRNTNRQGNIENRQGNRKDNLENRDKDREDYRDERWDHQDDVRDERRDYAEDVRSERREWAEHSEWNDGIIEWNDGAEWANIVAAGILVTGTAIAVSSFNNAPCTMTSVKVNNQTYYQCDNYWYQEAYQGGEVVYVVVNSPY